MRDLPAHPEVPDALSRLRSAGFPLATLTNSSPEMARAQLEHAGILEPFVLGRPPDITGSDLAAVADAILAVDEPPR